MNRLEEARLEALAKAVLLIVGGQEILGKAERLFDIGRDVAVEFAAEFAGRPEDVVASIVSRLSVALAAAGAGAYVPIVIAMDSLLRAAAEMALRPATGAALDVNTDLRG